MKLKLKDLKANPYKKFINEGKLNKETIKKIRSNIKELGLMGALPVFKKDNEYYLISGHHRKEALREEFNSDYEVEVVVHNYTDDNILRGMVVENITQREDDLMECAENLALIRNYLVTNPVRPSAVRTKSKREKGELVIGGAGDIARWLNSNGEVISRSKIQEYIKVYDNLNRELLENTKHIEGGTIKEKNIISKEEAKNLARLPKDEQKQIKALLDDVGMGRNENNKMVTVYLNSPEELKKAVKEGEFPFNDLPDKAIEYQLDKARKENNREEIISTIDEITTKLNNEWSKLSSRIKQSKKIISSFENQNLYSSFNGPYKKRMFIFIDVVKKEMEDFLKEIEKFSEKMVENK